MKTSFLFIWLSLFFWGAGDQLYSQNLVTVHSHNDYEQAVPFWNAYANGASSIEADIFLKDNMLYVSHDQKGISATRTLEDLYLKPLETALKMYNRKIEMCTNIN